MSLKPMGTPLPCPAQEDLSLSQGGQGLLPCQTQGALSVSQGSQGLLPYLVKEDLSTSLKPLGAV